ncbi:hydrogenase, partial [bacterium]|nr:hydrogenase [bacterium]
PITNQVLPYFQRLYDAVPKPKLVFAIGSCSCGGGIWYDTYNVIGGVDKIVPVDFYVPGCPPRPEAILYGFAVALGLAPKKVSPIEVSDVSKELIKSLGSGTF